MPLDSRRVERCLRRKLKAQVANTDHKLFFIHDDEGDLLGETKISHGPRHDIGDHLIRAMSHQLGVSKNLFVDLVGCEKSRNDYLEYVHGSEPA